MSDIQSEKLDQFLPAFLKAQKAMKAAAKDKPNPHFKTKYATFESVLEAVMPPLWENGFVLTHQTERVAAGSLLITKITHTSEQWIGTIFPISEEVASNPQKMGSALTYGKRYNTSSLTNVATEEDDDGNHAAGRNNGAPPAPQPDGSLPIYQELVKALRATTTADEMHVWKEASKARAKELNETYFNMLVEMAKEHARGFAVQEPPKEAKTPAKKLSMAERAIAAEKNRNAPMPDDEVRFE
jgi:hypothetical protein